MNEQLLTFAQPLGAFEQTARRVTSLDALLAITRPSAPPDFRVFAASGLTPAAVYATTGPAPYRWLLESAQPDPPIGSYSFITGAPQLLFWHRDGANFLADPLAAETLVWDGDPFLVLRRLLQRYIRPFSSAAPTPFAGGLAGYLGYNLRRWIEQPAPGPPDDIGLPDCLLGLYDRTLTFQHASGQLIASAPDNAGLDSWTDLLSASQDLALPDQADAAAINAVERVYSLSDYLAAVTTVKRHIYAGDIYQANLTQRWAMPFNGAPWDLYLRLRHSSPAPFAAFCAWPGAALVSASPERFLRLAGREVATHPIKGTRPRGVTPAADRRLRDELAASEKDRAENLMIVDLLRNDLGRVCEIGSVRVPELMAVHSFAQVHHLVSTVTGRLAPGRDVIDLLRACWPGGSITGAPKIRAMEIIAALEPIERGVYCGSIGYLGFDGAMDTSIVIRTAVIANGCAFVNAGGGIVADSEPLAEYRESLGKAAALLRALGADPVALDESNTL